MSKAKLTIVVTTELDMTVEEAQALVQERRGLSFEEALKHDAIEEIIEPNFDMDKDEYIVEVELSE